MTEQRPEIKFRPNKPAKRLFYGFPWAFDNELVLDRRTRKLPAGTLVDLVDADRRPLAVGAFNGNSKITVRVLDRDMSAKIDADWFVAKVQVALAHRERIFEAPFYRLIHAEGDGMPGIIVDRFGGVLVVQPNAAWAEAHLDLLVDALVQVTGVQTVVKNGMGRARALEELPLETVVLRGAVDAPIPVVMNGATYMADLLGGQKTGLFYDQRSNHAFAASLAKDARVLDVFAHVGGFSLAALANGARCGLAVDGAEAALELARQGATHMGVSDRFETRKGDAFDVMTALAKAGEMFNLVVCDPPAFAPAKQTLEKGLRAYEKVARQGAALVEPGGYLGLCSCSHAADLSKFREVSLRGVARAGRQAQVIHTGFASGDHPVHPQLAETAYLKAIFLRIL